MKKLIILVVFSLIIVITSCTKEDAEKLECEIENIGYIIITNTSDNPYNVYIDDVFVFQLEGHTFKDDYEVSQGSHMFRAEQVSGYLFFPTIRENTDYISHCQKISWVFP
jgi:hypothetical protein